MYNSLLIFIISVSRMTNLSVMQQKLSEKNNDRKPQKRNTHVKISRFSEETLFFNFLTDLSFKY